MNSLRLLTYNALLYTLSPILLAVTVIQAIKRKGGWLFLSARMGWRRKPISAHPLENQAQQQTQHNTQTRPISGVKSGQPPRRLWFHAASVGEVNSILPLLHYVGSAWPALPTHVTCTTPESLGILRRLAPDSITSDYCPIDFSRSINSLFKRINPMALFVVETEIWPNLYTSAHKRRVPLIIINGRVSEKTLHAPRFVLGLYRQVLQHVTLLLSRSATDTDNFAKLGVTDNRIKTIGNIKSYSGDAIPTTPLPELKNSRYLLAASTHDPEERQLCDALSELNLLLVIAPRHVQRSSGIQQMLTERRIAFSTRSHNEAITADTRVSVSYTHLTLPTICSV